MGMLNQLMRMKRRKRTKKEEMISRKKRKKNHPRVTLMTNLIEGQMLVMLVVEMMTMVTMMIVIQNYSLEDLMVVRLKIKQEKHLVNMEKSRM